jgi:N utilization substance protein A
MQTPRTEFAQALQAVAQEHGLDPDVIMDTIKQAIIAAYKRDARERGEETEEDDFDVELNSRTGEARVFSWPMLAEDASERDIKKAKENRKDVTPPGFGRIAAQTAKQVIHQKIREAEKGVVMDEFSGRIGGLISGMILRFDGPDVRVDLGRTEGLMPKEERVPNERLNPNQRLTFLLEEIKETPKGKLIILSRSTAQFVQKLFEREVPEMASGSVEVKAIAREAGVRTKMSVFSNQSGVDPVGSCVGQKGVRVQAVTNELGGERVDIIPWNEDITELIKASLAPAENLSVKLNEKEKVAIVKAPEDQLSLAIGKDGQNARLAAKLTGWKIEIKEIPGEKKDEKNEKKEDAPEGKEKTAEKTGAKAVKVGEEPETEAEKATPQSGGVSGSEKEKGAAGADNIQALGQTAVSTDKKGKKEEAKDLKKGPEEKTRKQE